MITLQDADLAQVHRTYELVRSQTPQNHKQICLGPQQQITQEYHWVRQIDYRDSQDRHHTLNVVTCKESTPTRLGDISTTTFKWLTNFIPTAHNVDTLANQAGRLRWKVENEGFNIQKNGGFNLQHSYSQNETARKIFYYLLQIAHLLFQLLEKGSLFRQAFPHGLGSLRNIASRLLKGWRNLRLSPKAFCACILTMQELNLKTELASLGQAISTNMLTNWEAKFNEYLEDLRAGIEELNNAAPETPEERHCLF